jgi:mRNA interferase RelE/StbE
MPVVLTDAALDDLRRLGPALARRTVDQIAALESEPELGRELVAGSGFRTLTGGGRAGGWRVVFAAAEATSAGDRTVTVWEVWIDGVRSQGSAYAEALHRMQAADAPEAVEHARLLERLGRLTGTVPVPRHRVREPVPDWLADALLERGAVERLELTAMDAAAAFARWNGTRTRDATR